MFVPVCNCVTQTNLIIFQLYFDLQTIAFIALTLGVAIAFPQNGILTHSRIQDDLGQFALSWSAPGHSATQQGALKAIETPTGLKNVLVQQGGLYNFIFFKFYF